MSAAYYRGSGLAHQLPVPSAGWLASRHERYGKVLSDGLMLLVCKFQWHCCCHEGVIPLVAGLISPSDA